MKFEYFALCTLLIDAVFTSAIPKGKKLAGQGKKKVNNKKANNGGKKAGKGKKGNNKAKNGNKKGGNNKKGNNGKGANKAADAGAATGAAGAAKGAAGALDDNGVLPNGLAALVPLKPQGLCKEILGQNQGFFAANGSQLKQGGKSCSSNILGLTPSVDKMLSTLIVSPQDGADFDVSKNQTVTVDVANLVSGFFSDANKQYYLAPQTLNAGIVQGHQHITIEKLDGTNTLDPRKFAFFKGINDAATDPQKRSLSANVPAGAIKENGAYRICSITGTDTHQPIISPVLQRGPQDDCIRINVVGAENADKGKAIVAGNKNANVADDNAQNKMMTVNGKATNVKASGKGNGKGGNKAKKGGKKGANKAKQGGAKKGGAKNGGNKAKAPKKANNGKKGANKAKKGGKKPKA